MNTIFDHRIAMGRNFVEIAHTPVLNCLGHSPTGTFEDALKADHVLFGHFFGTQFEQVLSPKQEIPTVVVCTTMASWRAENRNQKLEFEGKCRFVLFERSQRALTEEEMRHIFAMTAEQANSIVEGRRDCLPVDLANIFLPISYEILPALSILCQGFLAVKASSLPPKEWRATGIADALLSMQWAITKGSDIVMNPEIAALSLSPPREVAAGYWIAPFNEGSQLEPQVVESLRTRIMGEWRSQVPEPVSELLDALQRNPDNFPAIVAAAYKSISEKLGQAS